MLLIARFGELESRPSIRVNVTALAGAISAFFETKRRPCVVAAHSVELSADVRLIQPMAPPLRLPREDEVSVALSRNSQSPQRVANVPVNSLQTESRYACEPPPS